MSEINLTGKTWTELVFEGRNKSYGAYELRRENGRTTLKAFFVGILFIGALFAGGFLMSSFGETAAIPATPAPPELHPAEKVVVVEFKAEPPAPAAPKETSPIQPEPPKSNSGDYVAVPTYTAPEIDEPTPGNGTSNAEIPGTGDGAGAVTGASSGEGTGTAPTAAVGPYRKGALDVQPKFPGGIEKFYQFVGDNFEKPDMATAKKVTVLVSFVVEIDGSLSDIRVLQNPGGGLDKEAIRVLKSLKKKWQPGKIDGQPVRTILTLPITIVPE